MHHLFHAMRVERCKQSRLERQHAQGICAGAFGEKQQSVPCPQTRLKHRLLQLCIGSFAGDKHSSRGPREPPDARPTRHFGFRHKVHPLCCVQRKDIQP